MDDLDHSIHISDNDWSVFYDESEECVLLLPSLASPDDSCLSDTEGSGIFSSDICTDQHEFNLNPDENNFSTTEDQSCTSQTVKERSSWVQVEGKHVNTTETIPDELSGNKTTTGSTSEEQKNVQTKGDSTNEPDSGRVALREEKERWFVTVNDNLATKQNGVTNIKKKQGLKKTSYRVSALCRPQAETPQGNQEEEIKTNKENEPRRGRRRRPPSHESEVLPTCDCNQVQEVALSEENISETTTNKNTTRRPPQLVHAESDELDDSADFFSIHSYDSESYFSAPESVEEPQYEENLSPHCLPSPTSDRSLLSLTADTDEQEVHMQSCERALPTNSCASLTLPSGSEGGFEYSADSSTWTDEMQSSALDTSGAQNRNINLKASNCLDNQQHSFICVPNVTITSCSAEDSLETYARSASHTQPVYAISAFWDEMEKLTINDILHLRVGRETSPYKSSEAAQDPPTSSSDCGVDCLSDKDMIETSDTADSDYFTQPDESKPDRSSCEFSTSDFEEEYWQFMGDSREQSPDTIKKNQQRNSPYSTHEEQSTGSEGMETPVPSEDSEEEGFDGQQCQKEHEPMQARLMMKSKSMQNVQALITESMSSPSSLAAEEKVVSDLSDFLQTRNCESLSIDTDLLCTHDGISFARAFDHLLIEINANTQCVEVYNPQDISVSPAFDSTIWAYRDEISSSLLHSLQQTPVPIFSCSHPTVRDLTIAKLDCIFFHSGCTAANDVSPMRVVSHAFIQADQHGHRKWKTWLLPRKIHFHNKGSICWGSSGSWTFPAEKIPVKDGDLAVMVINEGRVRPASSQLFRELEEQQRMLETIQATKPEGIFSSLKQSDMCLVCIAFASWVLRSSDPEAADSWKAALLANVSALSAIQYLRRYVKKRSSPHDDP
ncbi:uncharacterized protein perm1b [Gouania willdenowi]|uniref:uncharacterized protein perm1b n=1 Tax=Gouania willdenowi TaxID=441366 RepID=UPI0010555DED|nr:uncharacterized protein LOC114463147 [Gouania willdenowi]